MGSVVWLYTPVRNPNSSRSYLALRHTLQVVDTSPLHTQLCETTHTGRQQTLPVHLAKKPQGRLNNTLVSVAASIYLAWVTINTYCLGIGTEGLLGDLRVLASAEVKRKVRVPQNI